MRARRAMSKNQRRRVQLAEKVVALLGLGCWPAADLVHMGCHGLRMKKMSAAVDADNITCLSACSLSSV